MIFSLPVTLPSHTTNMCIPPDTERATQHRWLIDDNILICWNWKEWLHRQHYLNPLTVTACEGPCVPNGNTTASKTSRATNILLNNKCRKAKGRSLQGHVNYVRVEVAGKLSHRLQGSQMAVPAHWSPQGPAVTALSYFKWQVILRNMPTLTSSIILNVKVFCAEGTANFQHTHLLTKGTLSKKGV